MLTGNAGSVYWSYQYVQITGVNLFTQDCAFGPDKFIYTVNSVNDTAGGSAVLIKHNYNQGKIMYMRYILGSYTAMAPMRIIIDSNNYMYFSGNRTDLGSN